MQILDKLNGTKYLIRGNHDKFADKLGTGYFVWVKDYCELEYLNAKFVLFHYPITEWNGMYRGAIHLHGHQHNGASCNEINLKNGILRYDVGVDANKFAPISADEILGFFNQA